jgi:hypothetical protein
VLFSGILSPLFPFDGEKNSMKRENLSADQAKELAEELTALSKLQSEAVQKAAYFNMSRTDAEQYDKRGQRIGELCALLGKPLPRP